METDLAQKRMSIINNLLCLAPAEQKGLSLRTSDIPLGDIVIYVEAPLTAEEGGRCDYRRMGISVYDTKTQMEYIGNLNGLVKVLIWDSVPSNFRFAPDRRKYATPIVLRDRHELTAGDRNKFDEFLLGYIPKQIEDRKI